MPDRRQFRLELFDVMVIQHHYSALIYYGRAQSVMLDLGIGVARFLILTVLPTLILAAQFAEYQYNED